MLHLDILQQHFALFLGQFQGLHLGNNTQERQTLLGSRHKSPFGVAPVLPAGPCEPVKPDRPLAAAVFLSLSVGPLVL